eukprot:scaffold104315_cov75-Phaeocystis_antarctica.AAC.4
MLVFTQASLPPLRELVFACARVASARCTTHDQRAAQHCVLEADREGVAGHGQQHAVLTPRRRRHSLVARAVRVEPVCVSLSLRVGGPAAPVERLAACSPLCSDARLVHRSAFVGPALRQGTVLAHIHQRIRQVHGGREAVIGHQKVSVGARSPRVAQDRQQAAPPVGCQLLGLIVRVENGNKIRQSWKGTLVHSLLQLGKLLEGRNRPAGPMPPRPTLVARIDHE